MINFLDYPKQPYYSYSSLNTYINVCQLQYYFRYIAKAEQEQVSVTLPFGSAFHSVLAEQAQAARDGKLLTSEEMGQLFASFFKYHLEDLPPVVFKKNESYEDILRLANRMFETVNREWIDYYNIHSVNQSFMFSIDGLSKPIIGEFDMVVNESTPFDDEKDPELVLVDFKTSSHSWVEGRADKELQATIYCAAWQDINGTLPAFRYDVVTKTKTPAVKHYRTTRSQDQVDRMKHLLISADQAIQKGVFIPAESSFACASCPFANQCKKWHRQAA